MARKRIPIQKNDATEFYDKIKRDFPNEKITVSGQSLGGSLAQYVANERNCSAITFNAYGIADTLNGNIKNESNIINYGNKNDLVFNANIDNQLGKTYVLDNTVSDIKSSFNSTEINKDLSLGKYHGTAGLANLEKSTLYQPNRLYGYVEQKVQLPQTETMADNTNSDIILKSVLDEIAPELSRYFNPQTGEADIMRNTSGEVYVHPYTRDDGTDVRGYYRSMPDKI